MKSCFCARFRDECVAQILPRVPEHPAFLSSPSHLDQYASLQSHHAWVRVSRSAWRRRPQRSSDPGLLSGGMPCCLGPCTEVSKPRGSCHSDACTVRWDSPTWLRRSPRTWRSSASLNHFARQVCRNWWSLFFTPTETDAKPAGDTANSQFKLESLYHCTVAQERTNQSADAA